MAITSIVTDFTGEIGVNPRLIRMETTDTLSTITTAGYLNSAAINAGVNFKPTDVMFVAYNDGAGGIATAQMSLSFASTGVITLELAESSVVLPTIANRIATYVNTSGGLGDDAATATNGGNIAAGLSGTAGSLRSYPSTAARGYLALTGVANTGDTTVTISNAAHGQASVYSIPDTGAATAAFVMNTGTTTMVANSQIILAKANGTEAANAVTASGNAGVITTSALTTAGGASYAITWTNTKISATSSIQLTLMGGTNTVKNITLQATAGAGTSTLTIYNNTAATALDGTLLIGYAIL